MNGFQMPEDTNTVADALTNRSAKRFVGTQVMSFASYFGLPLTSTEDSIGLRRATAEIHAIKLAEGYGGHIHVLTTEGEWLISNEIGFVGLNAVLDERLSFWGSAHIAETLPKMPGCSAREHGKWPCACLGQRQRQLVLDALRNYQEMIEKSVKVVGTENEKTTAQELADIREAISYMQGEWIQSSK